MDQDNSKGQDKRNWRERLGIGAQGNKDLPKISDDFRKDAPPTARVATPARPISRANPVAVKPAPMAPRSAAPRVPTPPVSPDKLAERLRSQREASTRLAEQRVQVARQRGENPSGMQAPVPKAPAPQPIVQAGPKPKFTFAEEDAKNAGAGSAKGVQPARPAAPAPQIAPARPPLGGAVPPAATPAFPPRAATPPAYAPPTGNGYAPPAGVPPLGYQPGYTQQPVPPYRPIDPAAVPGGYVPRTYSPPPAQGYVPGQGPRLNVPPRAMPPAPPGYAPQQDLGANRPARIAPTAPAPQQSDYDGEFYDEMPSPRAGARPSRTDYQQAYREAEYGYEEEVPRSKAPWILAGLLLLALLVAGGGVWFYQNSVKPMMSGQSGTQEVPVVVPPDTPAKVEAEPQAVQQPAGAASPSKKQIYDRIVGDQEVLGGDVTAPAETPAAIPEPTNEAPAEPATPAPSGSGDDAAPLPIPPPPPAGSDQQGDLGSSTEKQSAETITPAASESQAAVAARGLDKPAETEVAQVQPPSAPPPPAPGELEKPQAEAETIVDEAPAPVKKKATPAKKVAEKPAARNLGAKPVVLVPPSKKARTAAARSTASNDDGVDVAEAGDGGLYGSAAGDAPANASPSVPQAPKKKRTLADLFNGDSDENAVPDTPQDVAAIDAPAAKPKAVAPKKIVATPEPETVQQQASGSAGFVVQLASFRSKTEASTEYSRLKAKHAGALGGYAPIISEAQVGGSTRYRLSVGRMDSQAQASAVCSSLFAGGERDCLVKRQ